MIAVIEYLSTIEDPRDQEKIEYPLSSLIFISLCAIFCGAEGWDDIVLFADSRKKWLSNYIDMSKRVSGKGMITAEAIFHVSIKDNYSFIVAHQLGFTNSKSTVI